MIKNQIKQGLDQNIDFDKIDSYFRSVKRKQKQKVAILVQQKCHDLDREVDRETARIGIKAVKNRAGQGAPIQGQDLEVPKDILEMVEVTKVLIDLEIIAETEEDQAQNQIIHPVPIPVTIMKSEVFP